jgi:hypothetical protein
VPIERPGPEGLDVPTAAADRHSRPAARGAFTGAVPI